MNRLNEAIVYVGTRAKYDAGKTGGAWLRLSDYETMEGFMEACTRIHGDEKTPEILFTDYECIPCTLISETELSPMFFELRTILNSKATSDREALAIWIGTGEFDFFGEGGTMDALFMFWEVYHGRYDDLADFARLKLSERHPQLPDVVLRHFDYGRYARELFCGRYWERDGHVFQDGIDTSGLLYVPRLAFHGSDALFTKFSVLLGGSNSTCSTGIHGLSFCGKLDDAREYGKLIYVTKLAIVRPINLTLQGILKLPEQAPLLCKWIFDMDMFPKEALEQLNEYFGDGEICIDYDMFHMKQFHSVLLDAGYDGMIYELSIGQPVYIAFHDHQMSIVKVIDNG